MSNSFYLTLPSNVVSINENKLYDYTTYFPNPLCLSDNYEVALTEFNYTKSWFNLLTVPTFTLYDPKRIISSEIVNNIQPGYYHSVDNLVTIINQNVKELFSNNPKLILPLLEFNQSSHTITMIQGCENQNAEDSTKHPILISFGEELDSMLGFETIKFDKSSTIEIISIPSFTEGLNQSSAVDMKAGVHNLMIYSDIVTPTIVGNVYSNLLRSVPVSNSSVYGEDVNMIFSKPYYHPISTNELDRLRINIKDECGRCIDFKFGRVSVTLHFRKRWRTII